MYVVIFRARVRAWRAHPEHLLAQQAGRERWYASYTVQVAAITREYQGGEPGTERLESPG
jgi:heme-degrading monooxygenase HmoA